MAKQAGSAPRTEVIEVDAKQLNDVLSRAQENLPKDDHELLSAIADSYLFLCDVVEDKDTTIAKLRKLIFGSKSERFEDVVDDEPNSDDSDSAETATEEESSSDEDDEPPPPPGHGRNGADAYSGAEEVEVQHDDLQPGCCCPECDKGKLYEKPPQVVVRIVGRAPLHATIYRLQKLRCHLCGKVFTATLPEEAGSKKYGVTAVTMIALLKYGSGLPFNRLAGLQGNLEIPLPASTQWDVLAAATNQFIPAYEELIRQGAQGDVVYNDDTSVRILELMGDYSQTDEEKEQFKDRTGVFTSGIVSTLGEQRIALFFSGRQHAGENLADVLKKRAGELPPPIQMSDALSRNVPKDFEVIVSHCIPHARRNFVDIYNSFSTECKYVLKQLKIVFKNDADAKEQELSAKERLNYHQKHSEGPMNDLKEWMERQFDERLVEPNSSLGCAITYMSSRWEAFTLFLRQEGAPLDNNICERALKKAILNRKNSLFYRTRNGARIGDMFMSLIHTCELSEVNPYVYLNELQHHADEVASHPEQWLPWNFQANVTTDETEAIPVA